MPRINPPPPAFAELINMCIQLGVMSQNLLIPGDFDPKISYWTELKEKYMKKILILLRWITTRKKNDRNCGSLTYVLERRD